MQDTWKAAKVGLMIVAGIAAAFGVYRYVEEQAGAEDGYTVYALFDDAQGLIEKSQVVIAGIPVGYIEEISLQGAKARVDIHVNGDVKLHEDASVSMRSVSILGESVLVLHPGTKSLPLVEDGDQIRVASESVSTDDVLKTVNDIAQDVKKVTEQMAKTFGTDEAGRRMNEALKDLTGALDGINETVQKNKELINDTIENVERVSDEGGERLMRILENVERTTADVKDVISGNKAGLDRATGEVDDTISTIHSAASEIEKSAKNVTEVTDRIAEGEGTIGRLTKDETLIDEVEGAAEGINNLVGGIARLQTIVELRSEYNFIANTFKSYVSLRLQPREDRYYLFQLVDDPRGLTNFSQTTIRRSPAGPEEVPFQQVTKVTRSDSLRFTLMFAKRVKFATFRFGILESTGGLGIDFHLFDDQLELHTDVFAVGQQTFPRLRVRAAYEIIKRLWVVAGVDDVLNDTTSDTPQGSGRDFFFGAMLRFNDQDLKSILPFAGGAISP
jgi:phospholipid/cholesterol/gamma-HCH transport system substrate-binding protein